MPSSIENFRTELNKSPVHGRSPLGYIEATRDEHGEIAVTITPGAFAELTHKQLTSEVRGALVAASQNYARTSERLFQRWGASQ